MKMGNELYPTVLCTPGASFKSVHESECVRVHQETWIPQPEPVYELKLTDLFGEPLEVLEGVKLVLSPKSGPMSIASYQFVQYGSGIRLWVYFDLVWGEGVKPWLIDRQTAYEQILAGIATVLARAGYRASKEEFATERLRPPVLGQMKHLREEGFLARFFDLQSAAANGFTAVGQWSEDVQEEAGLPYMELTFTNNQWDAVFQTDHGVLLRRSQYPHIDKYIGQSLWYVDGRLIPEEMLATRQGGTVGQYLFKFTAAEAFDASHPMTLTDTTMRVYANLPGFVTMDSPMPLCEMNPEEWILVNWEMPNPDSFHTVVHSGKNFFKLEHRDVAEGYTDADEVLYYVNSRVENKWVKEANSIEWTLASTRTVEDDMPVSPIKRSWFSRLLATLGIGYADG